MWTSTTARGWALRYLGIFSAAALLSPVAAYAWLPTTGAILVVAGLSATAAMAIYFFEPWGWDARGWCLTGAMFVTMLVGGFGAATFRDLSLLFRGEPVIATVLATTDENWELTYRGERIPGWLPQWPDGDATFGERDIGALGDTVIVTRDPLGLVGPDLPGEVARTDPAALGFVLLVIYALLAILCTVAGRLQMALPNQGAGAYAKRPPSRRGRSPGLSS